MKGEKATKQVSMLLFCYAIIAKIKWQIVIKLEENKLMFAPSQAQLSFHLDSESFTHSQLFVLSPDM